MTEKYQTFILVLSVIIKSLVLGERDSSVDPRVSVMFLYKFVV